MDRLLIRILDVRELTIGPSAKSNPVASARLSGVSVRVLVGSATVKSSHGAHAFMAHAIAQPTS